MSVSARDTFALTTPLYYVNDLPHIGSAYTTMAADVIARFQRLRGKRVLLVTGLDEHGQKIQRAAAAHQQSPQEHCDRIASGFRLLWDRLNIQYDRFIRTTDPRHTAIVYDVFQRVWDQGDIYSSQQQGWYCVACEEFKEERELLDDRRCPIHTNQVVEWRDEQNYFFRLSRYQAILEDLYEKRPDFIQPESRRNEVLSFVSQGLKDFSISRVNVQWGIPVPTDATQTLYVWFDALLGYITALLDPEDDPKLDNAVKTWYPFNLHLIGKDILRFHAVYFPAMLISAGLPLPHAVFGHGFLTKDGQKMGKSLGNTIDPIQLVDRYGADAVRFYFMKEIEFGRDGDFNEQRFVNTVNADLANDLGNLLNRTLQMTHKYCGGVVPVIDDNDTTLMNPLKNLACNLGKEVSESYEHLALHNACESALAVARYGNKFIDEQAPWKRYKQGEQAAVRQILYAVLESVRLIAYLLSPVIPGVSTRVYHQLGYEVDFNRSELLPEFAVHANWGALQPMQPLAQPSPVFQRLELST
ncbi:MAG: methionine--tRNA ligase [Cyanobacteria bacterium]|nr:methionine--tRNA ligase [Cyanobacteriota bacterium]MDW8202133.1 methionine--tRNA ligase [Cyanobacteriota bacterium SKYGB_h_bin112]